VCLFGVRCFLARIEGELEKVEVVVVFKISVEKGLGCSFWVGISKWGLVGLIEVRSIKLDDKAL
jgi:hypothetical protein